MKKVAVFGNAGGGKSTLSRRLAALTGLPLHVVDVIQYPNGGARIPDGQYRSLHAELLRRDAWIIDGYGCRESAWERFAAADTLVYVDLPLPRHFLWITKRLVTGMFKTPEGWPEGSPMIRSSISSYRVLWPCHRYLTPRYRELVAQAQGHKRVHHLRALSEIEPFLSEVRAEVQGHGGAFARKLAP